MATSDRSAVPVPPGAPRADATGADHRVPYSSTRPPTGSTVDHRPPAPADGWREAAPHDVQLVVVSGAATVELGDGTRTPLVAGEVYGVPPGTAHRATAGQPCEILRIGPPGTVHTEHLPSQPGGAAARGLS